MKILHIVSGSLDGGAARGAYWLHQALEKQKQNSIIVNNSFKSCDEKGIVNVIHKQAYRQRQEWRMLITYTTKQMHNYSTGFLGFDFTTLKEYQDADIVHLHWINNSFVNIKDLQKIDKPIVWTIRDMWPMTGGCHYSYECRKYQENCGACEQLDSDDEYDLSNLVFEYKKQYLPKNIQLVGISNWISDELRKSALFKKSNIKTIFNNINTAYFTKIDKLIARKKLNLVTKKKIILVGANNLKDKYKGFDKFVESTKYLNKDKYLLCVFGKIAEASIRNLGFEYTLFGMIRDTVKMNLIYSCADVFVAPSIKEAFGKTLAESMLCGTPVACFDASGPKDIVEHKIDGYRAKAYDVEDLALGIEWIIENDNYKLLVNRARSNAYIKFDSQVIAKQYIKLYKDILNNFKKPLVEVKRISSLDSQIELLSSEANAANNYDFSIRLNSFYESINDISKRNGKYIIYGNGTVSKIIQKMIPVKVVGYVDISDKSNHPTNLKNMDFDGILISVLGREKEIIKYLVEELDIQRDIIVTFDV